MKIMYSQIKSRHLKTLLWGVQFHSARIPGTNNELFEHATTGLSLSLPVNPEVSVAASAAGIRQLLAQGGILPGEEFDRQMLGILSSDVLQLTS